MRLQSSQRRAKNRSPIWYLIGIDPVEPLKILTVGKSIHFRRETMPCTCVCERVRVWVLCRDAEPRNTKTKKGAKTLRVTHQRKRGDMKMRDKKNKTKDEWDKKKRVHSQHGNREQNVGKQQTSFNISSEMIYLSTLWQHHPSGQKQTNKILNNGSTGAEVMLIWACSCSIQNTCIAKSTTCLNI